MFAGAIALSIGMVATGLGGRLRDFAGRPSTVVLLVVLVACSLVLVVLRRRALRAYLPPHSGREAGADGPPPDSTHVHAQVSRPPAAATAERIDEGR